MPDGESNWRKKIGNPGKSERKQGKRKSKDNWLAKEEDGDPPRIGNSEDDTANTWNHHYQASQDKKGEQWLQLTVGRYGLKHQR